MSQQPEPPTREQIALRALNEHGFLLQNRVADLLLDQPIGEWRLDAVEFPISFGPLQDETRVDLVLRRHVPKHNVTWHVPIECKRPNPQFKTWLFFNSRQRIVTEGEGHLYLEAHDLSHAWSGTNEPPLTKRLGRFRMPKSDMPEIFTYYVEARENPSDRKDSSSSTKAIEDAFYQLTLGSVGLGREFQRLHMINYRLLPVVLTTAELFAAEFPVEAVDLKTGALQPQSLTLRAVDWTCVNYAVSENLARMAELSSTRGRSLSEALSHRLLRSIFVVRAIKLTEFFGWVDKVVDLHPA